MRFASIKVVVLLVSSYIIMHQQLLAQCSNPYTSYPVTFDFEANDGGWKTGGTSSDWIWGHPAKTLISGAAQGQKCWITGGLVNSKYNDNERSWLQAPNCFNFTNVQNPYVEFSVFWEIEQRFDGANFQYSTDGLNWSNVGTANSTDNCIQKNWFNFSPILNLAGPAAKDGWSGNVQATSGSCQGGGGSGAWVVARHEMYNLAGLPRVFFRFTFGSGSTCNAYDGFAVDNIIISNRPPGPTITGVTKTDAACPGTETGSASATATGGFPPYTYQWVSSQYTYDGESVPAMAAGSYVLSVTDDNGCTTTMDVEIGQLPALTHSVSTTVATCGDNNGTASVSEKGGAPPYTYAWNPNVSSASTASSLAPGDYIVTITDSKGCFDTAHINVGFTNALAVTIDQKVDVSCFGAANGSATASSIGGGPFTYQWSPVGGNNATADNLPPGSYSVVVTSNAGCTGTANVDITEPAKINTVLTSSNTTCGNNDGTASATVSGGVGLYKYLWSPGNFTTAAVTGLAAGTYTLTVTDANGCTQANTVTIESSSAPQITDTAYTNVTCNGQTNGAASATVSGGSTPYSYTWTSGTNTFTTEALSDVAAGNYNLSVTDAGGCSTSAAFAITEPAALNLVVTTVATACGNPGAASASVGGGTVPYSYSWSTGSTTNEINDVLTGTYSITVTDANACIVAANNIRITSLPPLTITLGTDTTICPGSDFTLSPGAFASYTWQDDSHTPTYKVIATGRYAVTVTDTRGCTASASVQVEVNCTDLLFPKAFTPNGDAINDAFGPLGTLSAVTNYNMRIYNRWGQVVFSSTSPYQKWAGSFKDGNPGTGTFVWIASYSFNGQPLKRQKGTLILIR